MLESLGVGVWELDLAGRTRYANAYVAHLLALPPEQLPGRPMADFIPREGQAAFHRHLDNRRRGIAEQYQMQLLAADGRRVWVQVSATPVREPSASPDGPIIGTVTALTDITAARAADEERRKASRALLALHECSEAVAGAPTEEDLYREVARVIVETAGYPYALVGVKQDDPSRGIRFYGPPAIHCDDNLARSISWDDGPTSAGPTATALRTGRPVLIRDIHSAPGCAHLAAGAAAMGLVSALALPVILDGRVHAALMIAASEHDAFSPDEAAFLERLAAKLAFGVATLRDRVSREQAQADLRASEARYKLLAENINDVISHHAPSGEVLYASSAAQSLLGIPPEMLIGRRLEELAHPDDMPIIDEARHAVLANARRRSIRVRVRRVDGTWVWVETSGAPILRDGVPAEIVSVTRNVTEQVAAEQRLAESERFARSIVDALSLHIAILDERGIILAVNKAWRQFGTDNGYDLSSAAEGTDYLAICDAAAGAGDTDAATAAAGIRGVISGALQEFSHEYPCKTPTQDLWFLSRVTRFEGPGPVRVVVAHTNVTERRQAQHRAHLQQAELAHLQRVSTVGQLAAGLAHELNQPLGAILNYAGVCYELAQQDARIADDFTDAIGQVVSETHRARDIMRRLRQFVRKGEPKRAPVCVNELVKETLRFLAHECGRARVKTHASLDDPTLVVMADSVQIIQVLVNLVQNALDAMTAVPDNARTLTLATRHNGPMAVVTVSDTGPGIAPEGMTRLFDAFYTTKPAGLGIGLTISRSIVDAHGGHLQVFSNPGKGTTFELTLPLVLTEPM